MDDQPRAIITWALWFGHLRESLRFLKIRNLAKFFKFQFGNFFFFKDIFLKVIMTKGW